MGRKMNRRCPLVTRDAGDGVIEIRLSGACGCWVKLDAEDLPLVQEHTWRCAHDVKRSTPYAEGYPLRDRMHRLLLGLSKGDGRFADHINGNGLDNRRVNLRIVTRQQNLRNRTRRRTDSGYRFKGVARFNSSRYTAYLRVNYKLLRINGFATQEEAAMAYNVLARRHFGDFAALNQVEMG